MSAKGYTGLSDAAERHIRELVRMGWAPENAQKMVEPIARAERNRALASIRGRIQRKAEGLLLGLSVTDVLSVLDEMEEVAR